VQRLSIMSWKQTQEKYVAILQIIERFKPDTLRSRQIGDAFVMEGEPRDNSPRDWYCIAFTREDMEFDEARQKAQSLLEQENQRRATGKPSLTAR
jgi:hypothetical protein